MNGADDKDESEKKRMSRSMRSENESKEIWQHARKMRNDEA